QVVLDVVGCIPVVGEIADLANAGISLARGDYVGAALSVASAIPFAGWAATGAKAARRVAQATKLGSKAVKAVDKAATVVKSAKEVAESLTVAGMGSLGKVYTGARSMGSNLNQAEVLQKLKTAMQNLETNRPRMAMAMSMAYGTAVNYHKSEMQEAAVAKIQEEGWAPQEAITLLGILTNGGRRKGGHGGSSGIVSGGGSGHGGSSGGGSHGSGSGNHGSGSGGSGKPGDGKKLGAEETGNNNQHKSEADIIAERAKGLDTTPRETPYKIMGSKKMKKLNEKAKNRTITKEEWKQLEWNKRFKRRRDTGVDNFWEQERERLLKGKSTRNWTTEQVQDIINGSVPKHNGKAIIGHHAYSASKYPQLANRGEIIFPVTFKEHLYRWHGGSYRKSLPGKPLNDLFNNEF
ncbi:hypothetical protein ACE5LO_27525, partial [Paenibacillus medicaginis]